MTDSRRFNPITTFVLSGLPAAIAKTFTAPIERVGFLLQIQDAHPRIRSGEVPRYTGIRNCFSRIATEQGILSFWRGNLINVLRHYPIGINYMIMERIKPLFPRYNPKTEFGKFFLIQMAAGLISGTAYLSIVYPLGYARFRLATDVGTGRREFKGLIDCLVKSATGPRGILGPYTGFGLSIAGVLPYRFLYFGIYDSMREKNPFKNDPGLTGLASRFVIAQSTAITAAYIGYPIDTIVRRLQLQQERPRDQWVYKGIVDCCKKTVKEEGMRGLFKGAGANVFRTVGSALVLVMYDHLQTVFGINPY